MKISFKNQVSKFLMGGSMPAESPDPNMANQSPMEGEPPMLGEPPMEGAPEQDPIMMLAQMAALALQTQNCLMMAQVCQAFLEIIQQSQGGAPQEPQGEPVFRKGGILVRRIKK